MAQITHKIYSRPRTSHTVNGGGGGTGKAVWGSITGTVTDQTDLVNYINEKIEDIYIPTQVSELQNDAGYIDSSALNPYALKSEIPSKTSDLDNDSGFVDSSALSDYALKSEIPDVPTKVSELENDAHYLSSADMSNYAE